MTTRAPSYSPSLVALDDALFDIQRLVRRPGYRARLLAALGSQVEISTVRVLRAVERAGATPPCIGDIAERLMVDPSTASRFVEQQVEAGYLSRQRHPDDGRRSQLVLTEAGQALLDDVTAARRDLLAEVTADWDPDDLDHLSDLLVLLREGFDQIESST
jgi:DNA-binding MarR family transcriptional regulator